MTLSTRDGRDFSCHKVVLASGSGYFRALFTGAGSVMREGSCNKIMLAALNAMELEGALHAIYDLEIKVRPRDAGRCYCLNTECGAPSQAHECPIARSVVYLKLIFHCSIITRCACGIPCMDACPHIQYPVLLMIPA